MLGNDKNLDSLVEEIEKIEEKVLGHIRSNPHWFWEFYDTDWGRYAILNNGKWHLNCIHSLGTDHAEISITILFDPYEIEEDHIGYIGLDMSKADNAFEKYKGDIKEAHKKELRDKIQNLKSELKQLQKELYEDD